MKYLTEEEFTKLSLELQKKRIVNITQKEENIMKMPYNEDMIDVHNIKNLYRSSFISSSFELCLFFSIPLASRYVRYRYPGRYSYLRVLYNVPKILLFTFGLTQLKYLLSIQHQPLNRDEFSSMSEEELAYKVLQEKTDIYDSVDAILDLKEKYSLYEINQLKKEEKERNNSIILNSLKQLKK